MPFECKNIVVGYDGFDRNEGIPRIALDLAQEHGGRLRVVHVVAPPRRRWWARGAESMDIHRQVVEDRRKRLEEILAPLGEEGVEVSSTVRTGAPDVEIIRETMSVDGDLVVVSDEPVKRAGRRGFGTVTMRLFRACPCPVLAKRDPHKSRHRTVLASVDLEPGNGEQQELNAEVLSVAASFARRARGKLIVCHAWIPWEENAVRLEGWGEDRIKGLIDALRGDLQGEGNRLLRKVDTSGIDVTLRLVRGPAATKIPETAAEEDADIVVMGTVGRSGLEGALIGNTAERLLNELPCSVLAVKPSGFVSPVEQLGDG